MFLRQEILREDIENQLCLIADEMEKRIANEREKNYIYLSEDIIQRILKKYTCNEVDMNSIRRKQVYTIIKGFFQNNEAERLRKQFLYLDSVIIIGMLKDICSEDRSNHGQPAINFYDMEEMSITKGCLEVQNFFEICMDKERSERVFKEKSGESILFKVSLEQKTKIIVKYSDETYKLDLKSDMDNVLNGYGKTVFLDMKKAFINSRINNYISYKLVYLNQYHGMTQQKFYFDKCYDYSDGEIKYDNNKKKEIPLTYSPKISSIYAIVGKNGTGKTSLPVGGRGK